MSKTKDVKNGLKLYGFRKQNGWTITQFTNIIGYGPSQIRRFEKGEVSIPQDIVTKLNNEYNIKLTNTNRVSKKHKSSWKTVKNSKCIGEVSANYVTDWFSEIRNIEGLSVKDFCNKYFISKTFYNKLKAGKARTISFSTLSTLAANDYELNTLVLC